MYVPTYTCVDFMILIDYYYLATYIPTSYIHKYRKVIIDFCMAALSSVCAKKWLKR